MESFLPNVDAAALKDNLQRLVKELDLTTCSSFGTKEAGRCIDSLSNFFSDLAEQRGTTPHAVLGQHIVANTVVLVLDRVVKPSLVEYCSAAGKNSNVASPFRRPAVEARSLSSSAASSARTDALEARRRRLRQDIVHPFVGLVQSVHTGLAAEGEILTSQQINASVSPYSALDSRSTATRVRFDLKPDAVPVSSSPSSGWPTTPMLPEMPSSAFEYKIGSGGTNSDVNREAISDDSLGYPCSQAPLLWREATPLNLLCNHIAEVLHSDLLTPVVGMEYVSLLLELLRWSGYHAYITPSYIESLSQRLAALLWRATLIDADTRAPEVVRVETYPSVTPTADEGCSYAQALMRLYALPQLGAVYPASEGVSQDGPSEDQRAASAAVISAAITDLSVDTSVAGVVQRLAELIRQQHQCPSADLRLEAYTIAALRTFICSLQYDHPNVASGVLGVVKLLCDYFALPSAERRELWRLEAMQFIAAVMSLLLSCYTSDQVLKDVGLPQWRWPASETLSGDTVTESTILRPVLLLLHQSVYPCMLRLFLSTRHEYSFVSRRELFIFPCTPLQEVFDYAAVVSYLTCASLPAYHHMLQKQHRRHCGGCTDTAAVDPLHHQLLPQRHDKVEANIGQKRRRASSGRTELPPFSEPLPAESLSQHPAEVLIDALRTQFFYPSTEQQHLHQKGGLTTSSADFPSSPSSATDVLSLPPLTLKISTAQLRTNSAAVQEVVTETALFLLHLFAVPCTTLHFTTEQCDGLLHRILLPLCSAFGLRLGPLLYAAATAVVPHCSRAAQQACFTLVGRRFLPAVQHSLHPSAAITRTVGDNDGALPTPLVYRLLTALLQIALRQYSQQCSGDVAAAEIATVFAHPSFQWTAHFASAVQRVTAEVESRYAILQKGQSSTSAATTSAASISGVSDSSFKAAAPSAASLAPSLSPLLAVSMAQFASLAHLVRLIYRLHPSLPSCGDSSTALGATVCADIGLRSDKYSPDSPIDAAALLMEEGTASLLFICTTVAFDCSFYEAVLGRAVSGRFQQPARHFSTSTLMSDLHGGCSGDTKAGEGPLSFLMMLQWSVKAAVSLLYCSYAQQQSEESEGNDTFATGDSLPSAAASLASLQNTEQNCLPASSLHHQLEAYLQYQCAAMTANLTSPLMQVPPVLAKAAESHWLLRLFHHNVSPGTIPMFDTTKSTSTREVPLPRAEGCNHITVDRANWAAPPLPRCSFPKTFATSLTYVVQYSLELLIKRATMINTEASLIHSTVAVLPYHMQASDHPSGAFVPAAISPPDAAQKCEVVQKARLLFTIQCIQLLHLLLRWRRAGLWTPPRETIEDPDGTEIMLRREEIGTSKGGDSANRSAQTTAICDDLHILRTTPELFSHPEAVLKRLSPTGRDCGVLYFAVLWLCHELGAHLCSLDLLCGNAAWVALRYLMQDVGQVLLHPSISCLDPRQSVLTFAGCIMNHLMHDGLTGGLAAWRPTDATSRDETAAVHVSFTTAIDLLRVMLSAVQQTGVRKFSAEPLADGAAVAGAIIALLQRESLLPLGLSYREMSAESPQTTTAEEEPLPERHEVLRAHPFLPLVLRSTPSIVRALVVLAVAYHDHGAMRAVLHLQQVLFTRLRFHFGPSLFLLQQQMVTDTVPYSLASVAAPPPHGTASGGSAAGAPREKSPVAMRLWRSSGRLLQQWITQLTDPSRVDLSIATPALQCGILQAAFAVLPHTAPSVSEALGRFAFQHLSARSTYAVRRHTAANVGILFHAFSSSSELVLQTLLTQARESILSVTPLLCATSLLALAEAARAAPWLQTPVLYTLLECWATKGFRHQGLIMECLNCLSATALQGVAPQWRHSSDPVMGGWVDYCRAHGRQLLYLWLCIYRHPIQALPSQCLGYATVEELVVAEMAVILPFSLMLLAEGITVLSGDTDGDVQQHQQFADHAPLALPLTSLFGFLVKVYEEKAAVLQPRSPTSGSVHRRGGGGAGCADDHQLLEEEEEEEVFISDGEAPSRKARMESLMVPLCLLLEYLPQTLAQLLVIAYGSDDSTPVCGERNALPFVSPSSSALPVNDTLQGHKAMVPPSVSVMATRALYWLEMALQTSDPQLLLQTASYLCTGCLDDGSERVKNSNGSTSTASNSAPLLLRYLALRPLLPTDRSVLSILLVSRLDDFLQAVVALTGGSCDGPPYASNACSLERSVRWMAERLIDLHEAAQEHQQLSRRRQSGQKGSGSSSAAILPTGATAAEKEVALLRELMPPPAAVISAQHHSGDNDAMEYFFRIGSGTFVYALLQQFYSRLVTPSSAAVLLRRGSYLDALLQICTRWFSAAVLRQEWALRSVVSCLLHLLRRMTSAAEEMVCTAALRVWPIAVSSIATERGKAASCHRRERTAAETMLAAAFISFSSQSPLVASTWAALCRCDTALRNYDWRHLRHAPLLPVEMTSDSKDSVADRAPDSQAMKSDKNSNRRQSQKSCKHGGRLTEVAEDEIGLNPATESHMAERFSGVMPSLAVSWSWARYCLHRTSLLAAVAPAVQRLTALLPLLYHVGSSDGLAMEDMAVVSSSTEALLNELAATTAEMRWPLICCIKIEAVWQRERWERRQVLPGAALDRRSDEKAERVAMEVAEASRYVIQRLLQVALLDHRIIGGINGDGEVDAAASATLLGKCSRDAVAAGGLCMAAFRLLQSLMMCFLHAGELVALQQLVESIPHRSAGAVGDARGQGLIRTPFDCDDVTGPIIATKDAVDDSGAGGRPTSPWSDEARYQSSSWSAEELLSDALSNGYHGLLLTLQQLSFCDDAAMAVRSAAALNQISTYLSDASETSDVTEEGSPEGQVGSAAAVPSPRPLPRRCLPLDKVIASLLLHVAGPSQLSPSRDHCDGCSNGKSDSDTTTMTSNGVSTAAAATSVISMMPFLTIFHRSIGSMRKWNAPELSSTSLVGHFCGESTAATTTTVADHLLEASMWSLLHSQQRGFNTAAAFLPRFVLSCLQTYGFLRRSLILTAFVPLLQLEAARATSCSVSMQLLLPVLLHIFALRESEAQRELRRRWSERLTTHVIQQAACHPALTRIFLQVLYRCHLILLRSTRLRGLKGAIGGAKTPSADDQPQHSAPWAPPLPLPTIIGSVPQLSDMKESYWLVDVPATSLLQAALTVQEPFLALLFAQLSGESLFGPRTGAATFCGDNLTMQLSLLHQKEAKTSGTHALSTAPYSILFPLAKKKDYAAGNRGSTITSAASAVGGRTREKLEEMQRLCSDFYQLVFTAYSEAVQQTAELDDATAAVRRMNEERRERVSPAALLDAVVSVPLHGGQGNRRSGCGVICASNFSNRTTFDALDEPAAFSAAGGGSAEDHQWLDELRRLEEAEQSVAGDHRAESTSLHLCRAALLLDHGNIKTSVEVLLNLRRQMNGNFSHSSEEKCLGWSQRHEAALRSLLAEAAWRLSEWGPSRRIVDTSENAEVFATAAVSPSFAPAGTVPAEILRCLNTSSPYRTSSLRLFHEDILRALTSLQMRQPAAALHHISMAEVALQRRFSTSSWLTTVLCAEGLQDARRCVTVLCSGGSLPTATAQSPGGGGVGKERLGCHKNQCCGTATLRFAPLPAQVPYHHAGPLTDAIRLALCQMDGDIEQWRCYLLQSIDRALQHGSPTLAYQWLSHFDIGATSAFSNTNSRGGGGSGHADTDGTSAATAVVDLALRRARVLYALGRPQAAMALLQPSSLSTEASPSSPQHLRPSSAPQDARVVLQLVQWHRAMQLVPPSQLVRDPFLSRAAGSDTSGACSFLLARLCHALAADTASRMQGFEQQQLRQSVAASMKLKRQLESQMQDATTTTPATSTGHGASNRTVLTVEQLALLRRRVRQLDGDIRLQDEEWQSARMQYALYHRSAINGYGRFLLLHNAASGEGGVDGTVGPPKGSVEDAVHAVFGFVELWLQVDTDLTDTGTNILDEVLKKAIERLPTHVFLPLIAQLTAQLGDGHDAERLSFLIERVAMDYPFPVVWPLLALSRGDVYSNSRDTNDLHLVNKKKIQAAQSLLSRLRSSTAAGGGEVSHRIAEATRLSDALIELAFYRSGNAQAGRPHRIGSNFLILRDIQQLSIPPPTELPPLWVSLDPQQYREAATVLPTVWRYHDTFSTPGGVNLPKVLQCQLSNGLVHRQLLKNNDDLRQDGLIEQVFELANTLFSGHEATRALHLPTFLIVPLAPRVGVLQWVENTMPLGEYIVGRGSSKSGEDIGAHGRYFADEPTSRECRLELQAAKSPEAKRDTLLALYQKYTPALHYFFLEHYSSPPEWIGAVQRYTRSVAASSMLGHVVGLGDRHVNNMLLHRRTAEVVHIDLGIAFDQNQLLPVPELVPFRLTRNVIDGLGVWGTEGSLQLCCAAALQLLRQKRELLLTVLEAVVHDPLASWAVAGAARDADKTAHSATTVDEEATTQRTKQTSTMPVNRADAHRLLARINAKLRGVDGGDVLSVTAQVRVLIEDAQKVEKLAVMFPGWSQWV